MDIFKRLIFCRSYFSNQVSRVDYHFRMSYPEKLQIFEYPMKKTYLILSLSNLIKLDGIENRLYL